MSKFVAAYLRLSLEDNGGGVESNSISSQRQIIKNYVASVPALAEPELLEFTDDGKSGTNFDRPGVKRLLAAVNRGEICCIVVKDFSRFGRKYLEVSKYIEQIFPRLGVRFIAVNDGYDSEKLKGAPAEIDVAFRNLTNAMYSRDISKKVKAAKKIQAGLGKYIHAVPPYGFKKDTVDVHRIVIDEPAAGIVRRIFALHIGGLGPTEIARLLNEENISAPSGKTFWSAGYIGSVLRNEQYTGTFIAGKTEAGALGSGKRIYKSESEWIKIPNLLPEIISKEIWDASVAKRAKRRGGRRKGTRRVNDCPREKYGIVKMTEAVANAAGLQSEKRRLYEKYKSGEITKAIYMKELEKINRRLAFVLT